MRRNWYFAAAATMSLLTTALLVWSGCGGSGGPITPPETGPGPSVSTQFLQLLPTAQQNATYTGEASCTTASACHVHDGKHTDWQTTRHSQVGVGCEQCHGGGSAHIAAPAKTNILTFPLVSRSIVCGQCHGPTHDQFSQSRHSGAVSDVINSVQSSPSTGKTCFRCHSAAFRDQFVDTPLAAGQTRDQIDTAILALTNDQIVPITNATKESASCGTCHNPHKATTNLDTQGHQGQLRRKTANLDTTDIAPGVLVKQYTTVDHECGTCHNARGGNPADSALQTGTTRVATHYSNQYNMLLGISGSEGTGAITRSGSHSGVPNQCTHCHVPQRRHTFTVSYDQSCQPCHTTADAAARAGTTRADIENSLFALRARMERWAASVPAVGGNSNWNYTSYITTAGGTPPAQNLIPIEIKRARHNYYFILNDSSFGIHNLQYTRYLLEYANQGLDSLGVGRAATITPDSKTIKAILKADKAQIKKADLNE